MECLVVTVLTEFKTSDKKGLSNCQSEFCKCRVSVYHNNNWTKESLISEIESIGFKAKDNSVKSINYDLEKKFAISLFFTLPLCTHVSLRSIFYKIQFYKLFFAFRCLSGLKHFGKSAQFFKDWLPNMDVLIMMVVLLLFFIVYGEYFKLELFGIINFFF